MKKILIIDDEIDLCILLKNYLTRRHFAVETSHRLADGLKQAVNFSPDIIFLDNNLPDSQGWTKAEWLLNELPQADIYLISAYKTTPALPANPRLKIIEKPLSLKTIEQLLS
ncbi:MAG TPA: response regulator [Parafilimonas sp.]|nr:response regulator [Parafilimonas sp.]